MVARAFAAEFRHRLPRAVDHAGQVQAMCGRFEPISRDVVEWEYVFWPAADPSPTSDPSERKLRTWTRQDGTRAHIVIERIPDYGIESALRGMAFAGIDDRYACLAYVADGIAHLNRVSDRPRRHVVTVALEDLRKFGIAAPANGMREGDALVLSAHQQIAAD